MRGLLYFAMSAPADIFAYESRIAMLPAFSTIWKIIGELAEAESARVKEIGASPSSVGAIHIDNAQGYARKIDQRIGRENEMKVGMGATFIPKPLPEGSKAYDLDDKLEHERRAEFQSLVTKQLVALIDEPHINFVSSLAWLKSIINYVPSLHCYKANLRECYRIEAAKLRLPQEVSQVHPLAFNSKNENITTDLKAGTLDFLSQIGQTPEQYQRRVQPIGGDGLTFQRLLELKSYLRFHQNDFESFRFVEPFLEGWHTQWTNLCNIHEVFWGPEASKNPGHLGHSAGAIGRDAPSDMSKVDFYPGAELVFLVLDARMIDCWT
jgi:hypothetical protein